VQRFQEDLGGGLEVQAFSWCVVVEPGEVSDLRGREGGEIGLSRQSASQSSDGIFDATLLPGGMGIAEEGLEPEVALQAVMRGELGAVVEGDGLAQAAWQSGEKRLDSGGDRFGSLVWLTQDGERPGRSFVEREDRLAVGAEEHEVGFPMAGLSTVGGIGRPQSKRNAVFDVLGGAAAASATEASFAFATRQVEAPRVILGACDLGGDEAIDGFMADDDAAVLAREAPRDLLRRPAVAQAIEDEGLQLGMAQQLAAAPAARFRLVIGVARPVADFRAAVSLQLPSDARWRAIQSCRNLPDRFPSRAPLGNLAPLIQAKVLI